MAGEALNPSADEETPKRPLPHPPPARARPSSPLALGRSGRSGRTARCPPPRPRGARLPCNTPRTKKHPKSLAGTWLCASFLCASPRARSLITLRSIESREPPFAARAYAGAPSLEPLRYESLRRSSIARSSFASLLFARSFFARSSYAPALFAPLLFARSSYAPALFARSLPALYLATH